MKRTLKITKEDGHKSQAIIDYLIDSMMSFNAWYRADGETVIEFVCDDTFYEVMLEEVPRMYRSKIEL